LIKGDHKSPAAELPRRARSGVLELAFDDTFCEAISMELFCTSLFKSSTWSRLPKESCYGCVL